MKVILAVLLNVSLSLCIAASENTFLDVVYAQTSRAVDKKQICKSHFEFKHAVARYIKRMEMHFAHDGKKNSSENSAHKKELRYLCAQYGRFSIATLLARLRSAHQAMVKHDSAVDSEVYKRYEGISSALLLICAHVFFNDIRNRILNALYEIDIRIMYWRYQQNHQIRYFFTKSPIKWVIGSNQHKEIVHNIVKLECKQRSLYTLLGSLTGHALLFSPTESSCENCYEWIEGLLRIVSCVKPSFDYHGDGTRFDEIAAMLEAKFKRISKSKSDCMLSARLAHKPHHFVRHWLLYTTALAATAYIVHYNSKNPDTVRSAVNAAQDEVGKFFILLLHPLNKIYERGKLIFSEDEKKVSNGAKKVDNVQEVKTEVSNDPKAVINSEKKDDGAVKPQDLPLEELLFKIVELGEGMVSEINAELEKSETTLREDAIKKLGDLIEAIKNPNDGFFTSNKYEFDEVEMRKNMSLVVNKIKVIKENGVVANEAELEKYSKDLDALYKNMDDLSKKMAYNPTGIAFKIRLEAIEKYLRVINDLLDPLIKYTGIIDGKLLPLFQFSAVLVEKLGKQADDLIEKANQLELQAKEQLAYADDQLRDHELTFMFTALIPLGFTSFGLSKLYQWATARNYSPIRVALAEVNSLLIESSDHSDDHDYGKLVYLISKLRYRAIRLHDSLSSEFLRDVAKLESKQYSATTKCSIIENMFNKYAFLGRVVV